MLSYIIKELNVIHKVLLLLILKFYMLYHKLLLELIFYAIYLQMKRKSYFLKITTCSFVKNWVVFKYCEQLEKWFLFFFSVCLFCFPTHAKALRNFSTKTITLTASHFRFGMDMTHAVHSTAFMQGHNYQLTSVYFFSPLIYFFLKRDTS